MKWRTGIGQDSHRFLPEDATKPCIIGGVIFEGVPGFKANSDGDIAIHAICNAITSLTGVTILGAKADELCLKKGITDSRVYLEEALKTLGKQKISHVALSFEGSRPRLLERLMEVRSSIAAASKIEISQVGITATTADGLSDYGCGDGMQCFCIITTFEE